MEKFSYLKSSNADYIEDVYRRYLKDPEAVDDTWRYFFEGVELGADTSAENGHANGATTAAPSAGPGLAGDKEWKAARLVQAYRQYGIYAADLNPLESPAATHPMLELAKWGLSAADLESTFQAGALVGMGPAKLRDIVAMLKETYCSTVGVESAHIQDEAIRDWVQERVEKTRNKPSLDSETKKYIHRRLAWTEGFEKFLHTRYVAQKRFSVEGGDSVIPMLDAIVEQGADQGAREFIIGMAHRGRLNVLTNVMGKAPEHMFAEFEGNYPLNYDHGEGDVKYHKGYSADAKTRKGQAVHLGLAFNPSHLEFVGAIVEGMVRGKQAKRADSARAQVVPIVIHGDAALAGQGVCYETLNMSMLDAYTVGGTLHITINNQVGFTTGVKDARSSRFATDVALMLDAPIFHVNGDDPEACWHVAKLATEFRAKFKRDVYIDLLCYRKYGHNEGDEPTFTQPLMYAKIKGHPTPRELYAKKLAAQGIQGEADAQATVEEISARYLKAQEKVRAEKTEVYHDAFSSEEWSKLHTPDAEALFRAVPTEVDAATLRALAKKLNVMPEGFHLHPKLARFFEARLKAAEDGKGFDWGNGEALAYATLLQEGHPIRITGQDAERGTFTHRHAVLNDVETAKKYNPFNTLRSDVQMSIHNSNLSETAVMGFEHGYSLVRPNALTIWEAQFGDFANGAQVIIDQFIATSESKWQRASGLTLLLPHGYEGQGPEHSSARLERFLQLCGRENMFVCNLTTPAQIFHALRRQVKAPFRKPLVIMSPKSLLRHPNAISSIDEFTDAGFREVIDDSMFASSGAAARKNVRRVLLCTGKVYYDLLARRAETKREDVAIVRVEQLHPFPAAALAKTLSAYGAQTDFVWVQEEPRNMGAWGFIFQMWSGGLANFAEKVGGRAIRYAGREIGSAPAVGSPKMHEKEQKALVDAAFA